MHRKNQEILFNRVKNSDFVVDIGGGAQPLRRANKVIDSLSYEMRGGYGAIGDLPERFDKKDWIVRDLCEKTPLPFKNKEVDFVFCSHVLEDLREPIWLCSEIVRIGKRGYIETPSRATESCRGVQDYRYPGYYHHRWLIEYRNNELVFLHKSQLLNVDRLYLNITVSEPIVGFFWEDSFNFREEIIIERENIIENYKNFVRAERHKMMGRQRIVNDLLYCAPIILRIKKIMNELKNKQTCSKKLNSTAEK